MPKNDCYDSEEQEECSRKIYKNCSNTSPKKKCKIENSCKEFKKCRDGKDGKNQKYTELFV
jgi:hypothetical protein